ncbi:NADH-quinone oxidoreductase subunit C [Salinibacter ruber]|uniref:NADH-quinone oxidoreductase subunit C n=1 Tax=Salinibacter ruber TaxID=146919 RepID=UPI00216A0966|nr:NADH-quinone oxidoreductase subunit C [Salinibacter ruber]MCS3671232.1 NADH-quinone oxidoreductase subunit C [Salinibacter ruber]MCS4048999.1 NADH-quinone oxidoreductase subunit C [Salinibacter ruber]
MSKPDNPRDENPKNPEELRFHYTPTDEPGAEQETENAHAKDTTRVPAVIDALREEFEAAVLDVERYANEDTVYVEKNRIREVCRFLKEEEGFDYFVDLGGIDNFTAEDRYEVFYNLVSTERQKRLRLKVQVDEGDMQVPSVTEVYRAANWNEREAYDMFGFSFVDHPDPRRMYMPEDFDYHPLRKEFPQLGIPGSLPLPPQTPDGDLTMDPFAAAHGSQPVKSYEEPATDPDSK